MWVALPNGAVAVGTVTGQAFAAGFNARRIRSSTRDYAASQDHEANPFPPPGNQPTMENPTEAK